MNPNFFNLSKRKKRDVLSELLTGNSSEGIISKKELNALNKLIGSDTPKTTLPRKTQPEKTRVISVRKKTKEKKRKTTHYLSEEVYESLGIVKNDIRSLLPENLRSKVSKSQIVNQALALIIKEFETKGEKSRLVRNLIQKT